MIGNMVVMPPTVLLVETGTWATAAASQTNLITSKICLRIPITKTMICGNAEDTLALPELVARDLCGSIILYRPQRVSTGTSLSGLGCTKCRSIHNFFFIIPNLHLLASLFTPSFGFSLWHLWRLACGVPRAVQSRTLGWLRGLAVLYSVYDGTECPPHDNMIKLRGQETVDDKRFYSNVM